MEYFEMWASSNHTLSRRSNGFDCYRLYFIPGASSSIARIYVGGHDNNHATLIYTDGSARVWDIRSGEFLRAMTEEKAKELIDAGGWINMSDTHNQLNSV